MSGALNVELSLELENPATIFSLVIGGWYPLILTKSFIHLLNRNVIIWMKNSLAGQRQRDDHGVNEWWLRFLDSSEVQINPILCALESAHRRVPNRVEFREEYDLAVGIVRQYLPNARLVEHHKQDFDRLYEVIDALNVRRDRESRFLQMVAPLLLDIKSKSQRDGALCEIFELAHGLKIGSSLVLLAVLSSVCEGAAPDQMVAARRVVKARSNYSPGDAHNALSDIRNLEMLSIASTIVKESVCFCTRDRMLAAFWVHLRVNRVDRQMGRSTMHFSLSKKLFPTLSSGEIAALAESIELLAPVERSQSVRG